MGKDFEDKLKEAWDALLSDDSNPDIRFDLYAQDINDWKWIQELCPQLIITSAGGLLPFQAEGYIKGMPFYYRDEYGSASIRVASPDSTDAIEANSALYDAKINTQENYEKAHFPGNLLTLIEKLQPSPYLYSFEGNEISYDSEKNIWYTTGKKTQYSQWGFTPAEAYAKFSIPSQYLIEKGISAEKQKSLRELESISAEPISQDNRKYPAQKPDFTIHVPEIWRDENGTVKLP